MTTSVHEGMRVQAVLRTQLLLVDYQELIKECRRRSTLPSVTAIEFANTHVVTKRRVEPEFRRLTDAYDFFAPDGMPLIWCLNMRGAGMSDRVYGPTFMRECLCATPKPVTHYLLGGSPELGAKLRQAIHEWNPETQVVGSFHGFVGADGRLVDGSDEQLITEINQLSPDFIWVGLGTPKQQAWIYRNKSRIRRGVLLGVGFGFDVNAGMKKDAPEWMQRTGLTWAYRLASEPRRLFGRYFKYNTLFVLHFLYEQLIGRRSEKDSL